MRLQQDPLADQVIHYYFPQKKAELQILLSALENNSSELAQSADESLIDLYQDIKSKSQKYNKTELLKGQLFFDKYASDIMLLLGLLSLPYCYAAAKGAEVLVRSERIINDPERRLSETAQFVFEVMAKNAFEPNGVGIVSILKVRLMHAAVRWYIGHAKDWDEVKFGKPVNHEDMAGTNLSFSLMVVRGLRRLGKMIDPKDADAYIQHWNAVGDMLGLSQELFPSDNKEAFLLEKKIRQRQFAKSEAGEKLTASLFDYFKSVSKDSPLEGKVLPFANFLLGDQVCEILGIKVNSTEATLFKPYTVFLKLSNQILRREDSYAKAFKNYKEQSAALGSEESYQLPN